MPHQLGYRMISQEEFLKIKTMIYGESSLPVFHI